MHFDHADIYGNGVCEEIFGRVLRDVPGMRDQILIACKCGIRWRGIPTTPLRHTPASWSPLAGGLLGRAGSVDPADPRASGLHVLLEVLDVMACKYGAVTTWARTTRTTTFCFEAFDESWKGRSPPR